MKKLLKNTLRGRCTYFFFRFSPEKIPSHNTVYPVHSLHFALPYFAPLHSAKYRIYWNVVHHNEKFETFYQKFHLGHFLFFKTKKIMEIIIRHFFNQIFFIPRRSGFGIIFDDLIADQLPIPEFITYGVFNVIILFLIFLIIRKSLIKKNFDLFSFLNLYKNPNHILLLISVLSLFSIQTISGFDTTYKVYEEYKLWFLFLMLTYLFSSFFFTFFFFKKNSNFFSKKTYHKIFFGLLYLFLIFISANLFNSILEFSWGSGQFASPRAGLVGLSIIIGKSILFGLTAFYGFYSWILFEKNKNYSKWFYYRKNKNF